MSSTINATTDLVNVEVMMDLVVPIFIGFLIINVFIWIWGLIRNAGMLERSGEYDCVSPREDDEDEDDDYDEEDDYDDEYEEDPQEEPQKEIETFREELNKTPKKKSKQEAYDEWYKRKYLD